MSVDDIIRTKLLADTLSKMSDDEKQMLVQLYRRQHSEIMESLNRSEQQIGELSNKIGKHPFASDLFANVAGNYITEGINWLVRSIARRL